MATTIAEPSELPSGSITPENENYFDILAYQKAADNAGIKKMKLVDWKSYLSFNSHKVNNLARYVGPGNYPWEEDDEIPYSGVTLTDQIQAVADKVGVDTTPTTGITTIISRVEQNENDISDLQSTIGTGGSEPSSLNGRITALETTVGDSNSGLVKDVNDNTENISQNTNKITALETTVGDSNSGLVKDVNTLNNDINDSNTGLIKRINDLETQTNKLVSIEIPKNTEIEIPEDIQSGIYLLSVAGIESNPGTGARTFHKSVYLIMLQTNGLAISSSNPCIEDFTNDFSSIFNIDNNLKIKTNNISYNSTLTLCKVGIV